MNNIANLIHFWNKIEISTNIPDIAQSSYDDIREEYKEHKILFVSGSNGPLFGSGELIVIDKDGQIIYSRRIFIS